MLRQRFEIADTCERFISDANTRDQRFHVALRGAGFVFGSPVFRNTLDINFTLNIDGDRSNEPPDIVAVARSCNPERDMWTARTHFHDKRNKEFGEFYQITSDDLQDYFDSFILPDYKEEMKHALADIDRHRKVTG